MIEAKQEQPTAPIARCSVCSEPRDPWNVTCTRSECQQSSYLANVLRNKRPRGRSKALKAK